VSAQGGRLRIRQIKTGFSRVVRDGNFGEVRGPLEPFGTVWGRGILLKGNGYLSAITGQYNTDHAILKARRAEGEETLGAFFFGYEAETMTLWLDYASIRTFDFEDGNVLDAIMSALKNDNGPLKGFSLVKQ
jgi:hypothetical protein